MAFKDFSQDQFVKSLDTGEEGRMGSFTTSVNGELDAVRVLIYIEGVSSLGGTEQIRCKMHGEATFSSPIYTSSFSNISDIPNLGSTNWIGYIRMDFNRENLNQNITYFPTVELQNYTRSGDTFFIGLSYDFPSPIYGTGSVFYRNPLAMQWFNFVSRDDQ